MRQQLIDHVRTNGSPLAAAERRALIHMAQRLPAWVTPDHLSGLGLAAMAGAGLSFWAAQYWLVGLVGVVLSLALNWFGDSLDGTLARVRRQERPRFGFYVDHVIDLAGATMLFCGLGASGFMSPLVALGVLSAYLLVSAEVYLATHVRGVFRMTFLGVGPTELRILLAIGVAALAWRPMVSPFGFGPVPALRRRRRGRHRRHGLAFVSRPCATRARCSTPSGSRASPPSRSYSSAAAPAAASAGAQPRPPSPPSATSMPPTYVSRPSAAGRCPHCRAAPDATAVWEMPSPAERVSVDVPGALVNHWRGRTFVPHADLATVLARVRRSKRCCVSPTSCGPGSSRRGPIATWWCWR